MKNSLDESGYTSWPLFEQSGLETPMIWEGKKGEPAQPVMPLDLKVRPELDAKYLTPKTIDFIKRNAKAKHPFFVYVGYSNIHAPFVDNPASPGRGGRYSDLIGEVDYLTGQILDAIKEAGVDKNTIVVLTSDNASGGAWTNVGRGSNGPFRGDFMNSPFEGCMRVPAIVRWPGAIPKGVVTNEIFAAVDWLPTFAGMIGSPNLVPTDRPIDGVDATAFMLGQSQTTGRDSYLFFGPDGGLMSVKWKIYKVIFRYTANEPYPAVQSGFIAPQFPLIFDLTSDPHEDNNLTDSDLTSVWLAAPVFNVVKAYETSVRQYPNIKTGEDFKGYPPGGETPGETGKAEYVPPPLWLPTQGSWGL